jgi:hypothetical protein
MTFESVANVRSIRDQLAGVRQQVIELTRELQSNTAEGIRFQPDDLSSILLDVDGMVGDVVALTSAIFGTTRTEQEPLPGTSDGEEGTA